MFKKSTLFSPLKFHIKALKNKEKALDELEGNDSFICFFPIVSSLLAIILVILLLPSFKVALGIMGVLSILFLIYHGIIISIFKVRQSERNYERMKESEAEEQERYERMQEQLRRVREEQMRKQRQQWEDMYRRIYEEEQKQKAWQSEYNTYNDYDNTHKTQQNNVDKNMINAMKLMGLQKGFTQKEVKSAYRKLSLVHHPDMATGSEVNFKKLNTAYNYIMERI